MRADMKSGILPGTQEAQQPALSTAGLVPLTLAVYACLGVAGVFASVLVGTVMSARKSESPSTPATFPKRIKKVRSISVSADLECSESATDRRMSHHYYLRSRESARYRAVSECVGPSNVDGFQKRQSYPFPFQHLPQVCQLKIFSYLSPMDLGRAGNVCQKWKALVKSSSLWTDVDLTMLPLCYKHDPSDCTKLCYSLYKARMKRYMEFIQAVKPKVKQIRIAFDIGDHEDSWLECLNQFFDAVHLRDLRCLYFNWRETPTKPYWEAGESATWTSCAAKDLMHKQRHRQRLFINFFDRLTAQAPNITNLIIPFEWSHRSLSFLGRLSHLNSLVLEKYSVYQPLSQDSIDQLFHSVQNLRHLILEVWTPSGPGLQCFNIQSNSLQHLDISQCRGFYLQSVQLPQLEVFKISHHPWNGPLISPDTVGSPCIYRVLCEGCPSLRMINEHVLRSDWQYNLYPELQLVFKSVCSCREHKIPGWSV